MKRALAAAFILVASCVAFAQDETDVVAVPVVDLPVGSRIVAYSTVPTETAHVLAVEVDTADGTRAFYVFDYVDHNLHARMVGVRMIPGDLAAPPVHLPETVRTDTPGDRFWRVDGSPGGTRVDHLVGAPALDALRFAELGGSPWQLSPPPDSALTIRHLSLSADGSVVGSCVLEPNIVAVGDRMSTFGAWWVHPFGEPHLLVGVLGAGAGHDRRGGLRLYGRDFEVGAATSLDIELDTNLLPDLVRVDLSGDGEDELLLFATSQDPTTPVSAFRFERRDGRRRTLAFSLCSARMHGEDVVLLQRALAGRGFSLGAHGVDGWYGPDTRAAVIRFQREAGLPVTGVVETRLWRLLGL